LSNRSKRYKKTDPPESRSFKGFDLGEQPNILGSGDFSFIELLNSAKIFACAYGLQQVEGFSQPVPFLALVGENQAGLEKAFEVFAGWGCESDGDVVDIHVLLRSDGTYQVWIWPEMERALYKIVPETNLYRANFVNAAWIKQLDTTHPAMHKLRRYCDLPISPVLFTAATGDPRDVPRDSLRVAPVSRLPRLIKFDLKIVAEGGKLGKPPFYPNEKDIPREARDDPTKAMLPHTYCWRRRKTMDIVFPISRERVRRVGLVARVRSLPGYANVTETQVVQAAINLMLSNEITPGDRHYSEITDRFTETVWAKIANRRETADNKSEPATYEPSAIARQIDLDVRHVLRQRGVPIRGVKFSSLQGIFRRKGYIDD
jgi:hypothetical protein